MGMVSATYLFTNSQVRASTIAFNSDIAHASSLRPMSTLLTPALANHVCAATGRRNAVTSIDGWSESRSLAALYGNVLITQKNAHAEMIK